MQRVKRARKVKKTSKSTKAMVPRGPRTFTFTRLSSSNQGTANAFPLSIVMDSLTGRPNFTNGLQSGQNLALAFRLDQVDLYINGTVASTFAVPNYTEFTNLFDQYCIKKVEVSVLPSFTNAGPNALLQNMLPWIIHANDYDNVSSTGSTSLMQYSGAKFTQLTGQMVHVNSKSLRTLKPQAAVSIARVTGSVGQAPMDDVWISTDNPNVQHFGLKMALDDSYNGSSTGITLGLLNFVVKYHLAFRDVV